MKNKIFTAQEVQAIIAENKKMFREVIRPQPTSDINPVYLKESNSWQWSTKKSRRKSLYTVGQKIFVKESFLDFKNNNSDIFYKSDFEVNNLVKTADLKWKPAQQMKQEQSRITLQIKSIWVENLSEISDEDIFAEGIEFYKHTTLFSPKEHFASYWNATHKKPEEKFEASPWVFVYNFELVK